MNVKEFIISTLKNISEKISGITLRYAYDKSINFHIIEVSPESIRRGNEEYMEMEYKLWKEFYELFPSEDILIEEVDETNNMDNLLYQSTIAKNELFCVYDYKKINQNNYFEELSDYLLAA